MTRHVSERAPSGVDLSTNSHDAGASAALAVVATSAEPPFVRRQREELADARRNHPAPVLSLHEGYAILAEEVDELWDLVRQRATHRSSAAVAEELVQVAAMAQRIAEDLRVLERPSLAPSLHAVAEQQSLEIAWHIHRHDQLERELSVAKADLRQAQVRLPVRGSNVRAQSRKGNSLAPGGRSGGTAPRVAASGLTGASDSSGGRRKATAAERPTPRKGVRR